MTLGRKSSLSEHPVRALLMPCPLSERQTLSRDSNQPPLGEFPLYRAWDEEQAFCEATSTTLPWWLYREEQWLSILQPWGPCYKYGFLDSILSDFAPVSFVWRSLGIKASKQTNNKRKKWKQTTIEPESVFPVARPSWPWTPLDPLASSA